MLIKIAVALAFDILLPHVKPSTLVRVLTYPSLGNSGLLVSGCHIRNELIHGTAAIRHEGVDVAVVAAADEDRVELQGHRLKPDRALLAGRENVFERLEGALEQVVELDHAAVRVDEIPDCFVKRQVLQARRERSKAPIRGDLAHTGVDPHLRIDGRKPAPVAAREVNPLDLHVPEDLAQVSLVSLQERREDGPRAGREFAFRQGVGQGGVVGQEAAQKLKPRGSWLEQQRVVAQLFFD